MEIIITSVLAFASTDIDDLFILTLFFGNKKFKNNEIIAGQFLGIITLIAISLLGSLLGLLIDTAFIGLLGLLPIYIGAKGLVSLMKNKNEENHQTIINENKNHILTIAGVTIANGGDNIGIYIPLFASLNWMDKSIMVIIFLFMTLVWCLTAKYLVKHPYVAKTVDRYGHLLTPFVLILFGLFIMYESGTFGLLAASGY